jgi:hypothetical protein
LPRFIEIREDKNIANLINEIKWVWTLH